MTVCDSPSTLTNTMSKLDSNSIALTKARVMIYLLMKILNLNLQFPCLLHSNNMLSQHNIWYLFLRTRPFGTPRGKLLIYTCIDLTAEVNYSQMSLRQYKIGLFVDSHALLVVTPNWKNPFSRNTLLAKGGAFCQATQMLQDRGLRYPIGLVHTSICPGLSQLGDACYVFPSFYASHCFIGFLS